MAAVPEQSFDSAYHIPVLLREIVDIFGGRSKVLDCTLGGGGHTRALLAAGTNVTGLDRDPEALAAVGVWGAEAMARGAFHVVPGDFTRLDEIEALQGGSFDGILADLGVSSHQIDTDARGFSFRPGVALDMRMSGAGERGSDLLNHASQEELQRIFREYGDEPRARRLAAEIVRRRGTRPLETSDDLVGAIRGALGPRSGPGDFARLFQAVRIAVNDELYGLARALPVLRDRLTPGGLLAIITYHSGEDRLVKQALRDWSTACHCPPRQPICTCGGMALGTLVTRKAIVPSPDEIAHNPRARSAKLRIWQKAA